MSRSPSDTPEHDASLARPIHRPHYHPLGHRWLAGREQRGA
jgi:hypothetical protein